MKFSLALSALVLLFLGCQPPPPVSVFHGPTTNYTLRWDSTPDTKEYRLYFGVVGEKTNCLWGLKKPTATISLPKGKACFLYVTCINTRGIESVPSNRLDVSP